MAGWLAYESHSNEVDAKALGDAVELLFEDLEHELQHDDHVLTSSSLR